jgi:hypothetical protein
MAAFHKVNGVVGGGIDRHSRLPAWSCLRRGGGIAVITGNWSARFQSILAPRHWAAGTEAAAEAAIGVRQVVEAAGRRIALSGFSHLAFSAAGL